jgi:oxygen-independent coproporphyrinogen-3 oxidase
VGPAAHSYDGQHRCWNVANNAKYIKAINAGATYHETETLTRNDQYNEYLMTRLRTMWGVPLAAVGVQFGQAAQEQLLADVQPFISEGKVAVLNNHLVLTTPGRLVADSLISDLFWV